MTLMTLCYFNISYRTNLMVFIEFLIINKYFTINITDIENKYILRIISRKFLFLTNKLYFIVKDIDSISGNECKTIKSEIGEALFDSMKEYSSYHKIIHYSSISNHMNLF